MYYLEDLTIREIKFIKDLLDAYRDKHTKMDNPLPPYYHSLKNKLKRLCKYVSFNPLEETTPKKGISVYKKQ
jgi:hypothetical protein